MNIGLTFDLKSHYISHGYEEIDVAEFDSEETIEALEKAIQSLGHSTDRIGNVHALNERLLAGDAWDLVFNIAEGLRGRCREAQVPSLLEVYEIPYTFSDPLVCSVTLDKGICKSIVSHHKIPTAKFKMIEKHCDVKCDGLEFPLFLKPAFEGTGKGITDKSIVYDAAEFEQMCRYLLDTFAQPVIVEEFLPGREFTVGIVGNDDNAKAIGTMEIKIKNKDISQAVYSYHVKENWRELCEYVPFNDGELADEVKRVALAAYKVLGCKDTGRVDVRCDRNGKPCFIEINPLPGLHPTHSDLPMLARMVDISYEQLIGDILNCAIKRHYNEDKAYA